MISGSNNICRTCMSNVKKMKETRDLYIKNIEFFMNPEITPPSHAGDASDHAYHSKGLSISIEEKIISNDNDDSAEEHTYSGKKNTQNDCSAQKMRRHTTGMKDKNSVTDEISDQLKIDLASVKSYDELIDLYKHEVMLKTAERVIIKNIRKDVELLATRRQGGSILITKKAMKNIRENGDICFDIITEMRERMNFLYEIMTAVSCKKEEIEMTKYGPIAAAYSILMFTREPELSMFQRLLTLICIRGHTEDMAISRLNKLGITMSTSSKIRLLDEAGNLNTEGLIEYLRSTPLLKITGDNLDIFVRTGNKSTVNSNKSLHLFATNALSVRISTPNLSNKRPPPPDSVQLSDLLLTPERRAILTDAYIVLICRIMSDMKAFEWMKSITPAHIYHPYMKEMSDKSSVYQLPLLTSNEQTYDECTKTMKSYETIMQDVFRNAHGNINTLDTFKVVVGGDQMTRVRLENTKNLRAQAPLLANQFGHLEPFICELWHMKQDFLEKLFKKLFKEKSKAEVGTLSYFKHILRRTDANGKVKSNFQAHSDLLKIVLNGLLKEQIFSFFGMENEISEITKNHDQIPENIHHAKNSTKLNVQKSIMQQFLHFYGYLNIQGYGQTDDLVFNYCNNLCLWGLQFLEMEDTCRDGDINRIVPNLACNIPFFYSHSKLSKYLIECVDYILKVDFLSSPLNRCRILEGSYVNVKGGCGNNVEADLVQEHAICHQKELIRQLGANKTDQAMVRITGASNVIAEILEQFDSTNMVTKKGSKHTKAISSEDEHVVRDKLRDLKPFEKQNKRSCLGFNTIKSSPFSNIDSTMFYIDVQAIINRLLCGYSSVPDDSSSEDEDDD